MIEILEFRGERARAVVHPAERVVVEHDDGDRDVVSIALIRPFMVIAKPPSPQTATTGLSGLTSLAASAAGIAKPIGPEPAACRNPPAFLVW